jgi:hypothetical protein
MKPETIFCITGFNPNSVREVGQRCFGFFYTFERALKAINCNLGDMNEHGWYSHLILEEMAEGLWGSHINRWFFVFEGDPETGKWVMCETPQSERHCCSYAMG